MRKGRPKLLVVDDDEAFRESMELEFGDRGFQVLLAPDHRSALQLAAAHSLRSALKSKLLARLVQVLLNLLRIRKDVLPVLEVAGNHGFTTGPSASTAPAPWVNSLEGRPLVLVAFYIPTLG